MTTATAPLPPLRKAPAPPPLPMTQQRTSVQFGPIQKAAGHRIVLYGPGGIGKTTLAAHAPGTVAFFDLDDSLPRLQGNLDELGVLNNIVPVAGVMTWQDIRNALQSDGWDKIKTVVIDSATKAEELAVAYTLANTLADGKKVNSIEAYGYGKGFGFVFDTFLPILGDLDRHARAGRNVILICHDCTKTVPNPAGEDWIRYEPRLQDPASGKASIRLRVREWADHVLFIGYDVSVNKDGKGSGSGTATLYPLELPHCMAKCRTLREPMPLTDPHAIWPAILK